MLINIEVNAKCRNCKHWVCIKKDGSDFLEDDETYCNLITQLRREGEECEFLELDLSDLQSGLKDAGYKISKISKKEIR